MSLIPKRLADLRAELLAQKQDNAIERKEIASLPRSLDSEGRRALARRRSDLALGEARITELEDEIAAEVAKLTSRSAAQARGASRDSIKLAHGRIAQRHVDRAAILEEWRDKSVKLFASFKSDFSADSKVAEDAVLHLIGGNPAQFSRLLEHALPAMRGFDVDFAHTLAHALGDIRVAAETGVAKVSGHPQASFTRLANQHVKQLEKRLPEIHTLSKLPNEYGELVEVPEAAWLGESPELVEDPVLHDKHSAAIHKANAEEAAQLAEKAEYDKRTAGGKPDEFVELMRDGKQPRAKRYES